MVHWIIQDKVFGEETKELIKYVKSYQLIDNNMVYIYNGKSPCIVRGTTKFIENVYKTHYDCNIPKLLTLPNYECSTYYLETQNLLNDNFVMMPW